MEIFGLFIQKLGNLRRIHDLQKFCDFKKDSRQWQPMPKNRSPVSGSQTQTIERLPTFDISSISVQSLLSQKQSHAHLAAQAAISYWLSSQNPHGITMSYGRSVKSLTNTTETPKAVTSHF